MFFSQRDFNPATTILQTTGQRDVYFDVKEGYNKMMKAYKEEVMKLSFNNKGDEIRKKFISDLFFSISFNSDDNIPTRPWFLYQKEKYPIRIKSQLRTLGDFLQKTETQAAAGPCLWVIGATWQANMKEPLSGARATHKEVQAQVEEFCRRFGKAKPPAGYLNIKAVLVEASLLIGAWGVPWPPRGCWASSRGGYTPCSRPSWAGPSN